MRNILVIPMSDKKVSIVIVTFNSRPELLACLKSCARILYLNYEIIIVENGSREALDLNEMINISVHVRTILKSVVNLGYPRAANLGIKDAMAHGADYVLLLNDDTEVAPDFLGGLVKVGEDMPDVGALGPNIYYFSEPQKVWFAGGWFNRQTCVVTVPASEWFAQRDESAPVEFDYLTGCCLLVKRKVIETIGSLDERFYLYWEDTDWILRMTEVGYKLVLVPWAHIWHKISVSVGGSDSPMKAYHKTRSHLFFAQLHAPRTLLALQWGVMRDIAWLLVRSRQQDRLRKARAYAAAIKDYYAGRTDRGPRWLWTNV